MYETGRKNSQPFFFILLFLLVSFSGKTQKLNDLLIQLHTTENDSIKKYIYADISYCYSRINLDTCKMYADSVGMIAQKLNDEEFIKRVDYYYAICEQKAGNFDVGLEYMEDILNYYEEKKDTTQIASMLYQTMSCYFFKRDRINFFLVANRIIDIEKKLGENKKIAGVNNLKASFYKNLESYDKAKDLAFEALRVFEIHKDSSGMAAACNTLGEIHALSGDNKNAIPFFERQHAINVAQNNVWGLGYSHESLGTMFLKNGDLKKAEYHLEKSLAIRQKIKGKIELAGVFVELAKLKVQQKQFEVAIDYATQSYHICKLTRNRKQQKIATQLLSEIYEERGDYKNSLSFYKKYEAEKDSMLNEKISQQIFDIETAYETKEKEEEITRLNHSAEISELKIGQQKNMLIGLVIVLSLLGFLFYRIFNQKKKIESQNLIISKALSEKDILLREIHHRVKNNLQLVSSLLGLQSHHITDPNALEALNSGKSRVKSMALIHQNLYNKENLTGVSVREYLEKLSKELITSFKVDTNRIELLTDIPNILLDVDTLIPMGLIINELLTNALKYAFPNNGEGQINIRLFEEAGQLRLEFSDNGIGIDIDKRSSESFGYKLIDTLLEQLEGEMEIKSDSGTKLLFAFNDYKIAA